MLVCSTEPCVCWFAVLGLVCAGLQYWALCVLVCSTEPCVCLFAVLSLVCVGL